MKNLIQCVVAGGLFLLPVSIFAQATETPPSKQQTTPTKSDDRGSSGAITMEEYETLLADYQKINPGKNFQNMTKEEFETYLTTELAKLRKKRAEEALRQKEAEEKEKQAKEKAAEPKE